MCGVSTPLAARAAIIIAAAALQFVSGGCASARTAASDDPRAGPMISLHVTVTQAVPGGGPVRCAVYADSATFMTRAGIWEGHSQEPAGTSVEFRFLVPEGRKVAVSAFQDTDRDEDLDRGPLGLPTEPWGTSGKRLALAPPSWSRSAFLPSADGSPVIVALAGGKRTGPPAER